MKHLSYSRIKLFYKSLRDYRKRYIDEIPSTFTPETLHGTLVDELLFNEVLDRSKYIIANIPNVVRMDKDLAQYCIDNEISDTSPDNLFKIAKELGLWKGTKKDDAYLERVSNPDIKTYIELMSTDKHVVDNDAYGKVADAVEILKTHLYTSDIFSDDKGIAHLKLTMPYKDTEFVGELDWVIIDHTKKIIKPYDLKTGFEFEYNFERSFWSQMYYFQVAVYMAMFRHNYPDYLILPFEFVYMSVNSDTPVVYEVSETLMAICENGGEYETNYGYIKTVPSYKDIADDIIWHYEYDFWKTSRLISDNNGRLMI